MKILNTPRAMIAGLVIGGAVMSIGCGSSSTATGTGGSTGTGGATGTGGGTGTGGNGSGGSGTGGAVMHKVNYTFDTDNQMWAFNTYPEPMPRRNLGGIYPGDAGTSAAVAPLLEFDGAIGSPSPGSLKVSVTFTAYGQYVDPVFNVPAPGLDLTGKTLHGRIQLTSGVFTGGAQLHMSTGADGAYPKGDFPAFGPVGTWLNAMIDLTTAIASNPPAMVNPAVVNQIGVQIFSSNAMAAGTPLVAPETVVFNIDTVQD